MFPKNTIYHEIRKNLRPSLYWLFMFYALLVVLQYTVTNARFFSNFTYYGIVLPLALYQGYQRWRWSGWQTINFDFLSNIQHVRLAILQVIQQAVLEGCDGLELAPTH